MGKSLIIKGADFSTNGFTYEYDSTVVKKLYYKGTGQGSLVEDVNVWPVADADGKGFYNLAHDNNYTLLLSGANCLAFKKYPVGDYTNVKVRTVAALGGDYVILACLDSNEKLLGGFVTTSPSYSGSIVLTPVGEANGYREFEMDIPEGTTHVIAGFYDTAAGSYNPFSENGFAVTLSKVKED